MRATSHLGDWLAEETLPLLADLAKEWIGSQSWVRLVITLLILERQATDEPGVLLPLVARAEVRKAGENLRGYKVTHTAGLRLVSPGGARREPKEEVPQCREMCLRTPFCTPYPVPCPFRQVLYMLSSAQVPELHRPDDDDGASRAAPVCMCAPIRHWALTLSSLPAGP